MPVQPRYARVYPMACALSLIALCPYLILTTAAQPLQKVLEAGLHAGALSVSVVDGVANGAFALGALLAADLSQRFESHRLFLIYQSGLAAGALVAGLAPDVAVYAVGRVLLGLAAGFMLIGALPQLIRRYDADHLPTTGLVVNIGLFGATVAGPTVGGLVAAGGYWRAAFVVIAAIGVVNVGLGIVGFESVEPERPGLTVDLRAVVLSVVGVFVPFVGVSLLADTSIPRWVAGVLVAVGLFVLILLIGAERNRESGERHDPLVPVSLLGTSVAVLGTLIAAAGGAVVALFLQLVDIALDTVGKQGSAFTALLFVPLIPGLAIGCVVYRLVFTRAALFGMFGTGALALLAGGGVLLALDPSHPAVLVPVATALIGYGTATTVSPGLFLASLGVPASQLARTFALVELLRTEATYLLQPVFTAYAGGEQATGRGVHMALFATLDVTAFGVALCLLVMVGSWLRPHAPQIVDWLDNDELGMPSPPTRLPRGVLG